MAKWGRKCFCHGHSAQRSDLAKWGRKCFCHGHSAERSDSQNPESTVVQLGSLDPASRFAPQGDGEGAQGDGEGAQGDGEGAQGDGEGAQGDREDRDKRGRY